MQEKIDKKFVVYEIMALQVVALTSACSDGKICQFGTS